MSESNNLPSKDKKDTPFHFWMAKKQEALKAKKTYPLKIAEVIKLYKEHQWDGSPETTEKIIQYMKEHGIEKNRRKALELIENVFNVAVATGDQTALDGFSAEVISNIRAGMYDAFHSGARSDHIGYIKEALKFIKKDEQSGTTPTVNNNSIKINLNQQNNVSGQAPMVEAGFSDLVKALRAATNPGANNEINQIQNIGSSEECIPIREHIDSCEDQESG